MFYMSLMVYEFILATSVKFYFSWFSCRNQNPEFPIRFSSLLMTRLLLRLSLDDSLQVPFADSGPLAWFINENRWSSPKKYSLVTTPVFHMFTPKDANSQIANAEARGECFAPNSVGLKGACSAPVALLFYELWLHLRIEVLLYEALLKASGKPSTCVSAGMARRTCQII